MEIFKGTLNFDFLGKRFLWMGISVAFIVMSIYLWIKTGDQKWGVDFRGGTEIIVHYDTPVQLPQIREAFEKAGFSSVVVQEFEAGKGEFTIRLSQNDSTPEAKEKLNSTLGSVAPAFKLLKEEFVGPVIGEQIRTDGMKALAYSLVVMLIYIAFRFEWRYGVAAMLAVFHDVIITVGFCILTDKQMSGGILAALLTIVGYSVNDTIIVFDRIRENIELSRKAKAGKKADRLKDANLLQIMNISVNETLSRTVITNMTVFMVVLPLWLFGGGAVEELAFALVVGAIVGTYSSIFVACPIVHTLDPKGVLLSATPATSRSSVEASVGV